MLLYISAYFVSSFLVTIAIERFMRLFYTHRRTALLLMLLSYGFLYIVSGVIFILLNAPIVSLSANVVLFFLVSLNYESTFRRRLVVVIFVYAFLATIEIAVFLAMSNLQPLLFYGAGLSDITAFLIHGPLVLLVAVLAGRLKNIKKTHLPAALFIIISAIIPLLSLIVVIVVFFFTDATRLIAVAVVLALITINIFIVFIHDKLSSSYEAILKVRESELKLAFHAQERESYLAQNHLMQESVDRVKSVRHEIKAHITSLCNLVSEGDVSGIAEYLERIRSDVMKSESYIDTGNAFVDNIINHKIGTLDNVKIDLDVDVMIPSELAIEAYDITIILSNLIDNALEALNGLKNCDKWFKLRIKALNGTIVILVENPYSGTIKFTNRTDENSVEFHTKKCKDEHGYGLRNVCKAVASYDGAVEISHENNIFSVKVLLVVE